MSIKITKLPDSPDPFDCNNSKCPNEAIFEIENIKHGAIFYSCEDHREEMIDLEIRING